MAKPNPRRSKRRGPPESGAEGHRDSPWIRVLILLVSLVSGIAAIAGSAKTIVQMWASMDKQQINSIDQHQASKVGSNSSKPPD